LKDTSTGRDAGQISSEFVGERFMLVSIAMNPQAEALKRRTFALGLAVIRFCRVLRGTWEAGKSVNP
jgi:hypothetical protein